MSTGQTEAQVYPRVTRFQAILTATCARHDLSYLVEMGTGFCHQSSSSLHGDETRTSTFLLMKKRTTRCRLPLCTEHACSVQNVTQRWKETAIWIATTRPALPAMWLARDDYVALRNGLITE